MRRFTIAAVIVAACGIGTAAQAACSATGASAGVSDVFRAQVGEIKVDIRTMGSPLTIGQPPTTAVGVCSDGTAGPVRGMHVLLTDLAGDEILCDAWAPDIGSYDPFGFGLGLGAGVHQAKDDAHPCGVSGTWDPVGYAAGVALSGYDPTRIRFPAAEIDGYGISAGVGIGSIFGGEIWWTIVVDGEEVVVTVTGSDATRAYYVRGAGASDWTG